MNGKEAGDKFMKTSLTLRNILPSLIKLNMDINTPPSDIIYYIGLMLDGKKIPLTEVETEKLKEYCRIHVVKI